MKNIINSYFRIEIVSKNRNDFIQQNAQLEEKLRAELSSLGNLTDFKLSQTNPVEDHIVFNIKFDEIIKEILNSIVVDYTGHYNIYSLLAMKMMGDALTHWDWRREIQKWITKKTTA